MCKFKMKMNKKKKNEDVNCKELSLLHIIYLHIFNQAFFFYQGIKPQGQGLGHDLVTTTCGQSKLCNPRSS